MHIKKQVSVDNTNVVSFKTCLYEMFAIWVTVGVFTYVNVYENGALYVYLS